MIFRRVLVANRGEIAVRIIRTCQRLGIEAVLAASEADLDSVPAQLADRTVRIGPAAAMASYLDPDAIVAAARSVQADAVHPGYGFLSESTRLANACADADVVFVGPTADQLDAVGDKLRARQHAVAAGVPVAPGGSVAEGDEAQQLAAEIGWPVLVKAVGGGGGTGLRLVEGPAGLSDAVDAAMTQAAAAFDDPRVYLERFVTSGRHVEVQVLGDGERVIHLGDRDCSIQRRYQKLVEEAPAPNLDEDLRAAMHDAAVAFASHLGYRGAGTVEFLVDTRAETFFFLEMNARIQVEHPVTEAITGVDLIALQLSVAEGRSLPISQDDVTFTGHAIECRVNAEDPVHDFQPGPGTVTAAVFPAGEGIRIDTHLQAGASVPPFYDSLVAKLIVRGSDRAQAVTRLQAALDRCEITGITNNLALHRAVAQAPPFVRGGVDTAWLGGALAQLLARAPDAAGVGRG